MNKLTEIILIGILFPLTISISLYELNWIDRNNEKKIEYHQKIIDNLKDIKIIVHDEMWRIKYKGIIETPFDNKALRDKIFECMKNERYYNIYSSTDEKIEIIFNIASKLQTALRSYEFTSDVDFHMKDKIVSKYDNNVENNSVLREEIFKLYSELGKEIEKTEKNYFKRMDEYINSNSIVRFFKNFR